MVVFFNITRGTVCVYKEMSYTNNLWEKLLDGAIEKFLKNFMSYTTAPLPPTVTLSLPQALAVNLDVISHSV